MSPLGDESGGDQLSTVYCASRNRCIATVAFHMAGLQIPEVAPARLLAWNGRSWHKQPFPNFANSQISVLTMSCSGPNFCVILGRAAAVGGRFGGTNGQFTETLSDGRWHLGRPTRLQLNSVSCPISPGAYVVVGGTSSSTAATEVSLQWDGSTWTRLKAGNFSSSLYQVSCVNRWWCMAIGWLDGPNSYSTAEIWFVSSWETMSAETTGQQPWGAPLSISSLSCHRNHCVAVGASLFIMNNSLPVGRVLYSDDDGLSWEAASLPAGLGWLSAVTCTSANHCVAVGSRTSRKGGVSPPVIIVSNDGGRSWSPSILPRTAKGPVDDLSCGTASWCAATSGTQELVSQDGGVTWQLHGLPLSAGALSCVANGVCLAVFSSHGTLGVIRTVDFAESWHVVWHAPPVPKHRTAAAIQSLGTIYCLSASHCLMSAGVSPEVPYSRGIILSTNDGGQTWTRSWQQGGPGEGNAASGASAIDCVGKHCIAVGGLVPNLIGADVEASSDGGNHWSFLERLPGPGGSSVACSTSRICVIAGQQDFSAGVIGLTINGGRAWYTPTLPTAGGQ